MFHWVLNTPVAFFRVTANYDLKTNFKKATATQFIFLCNPQKSFNHLIRLMFASGKY